MIHNLRILFIFLKKNREFVKKKCISVWLNAHIDVIYKRITNSNNIRPIFSKLQRISQKNVCSLFPFYGRSRRQHLQSVCPEAFDCIRWGHHTVDIDGNSWK